MNDKQTKHWLILPIMFIRTYMCNSHILENEATNILEEKIWESVLGTVTVYL